ncbi:MAG: hypothetical protein QM790_14135 [Nibricoccus sp.]
MSQPLFSGVEGLGARRIVIAVVACVFAIWAGVTLADSPYLVFTAFISLLYVGTLAVNAKTLAWLVIALQPAALIVPFFPGRPFWWELCALLSWPSLLVYFLVNRQKVADLKFDRLEKRALLALVGYVLVLIALMFYRGVGFRVLGGEQMGGRFYTQQMVLVVLPLLMLSMRLSKKQLVVASCVGWGMSFTYLISDFALSWGGVTQKVLYFFEVPTDAVTFELGFEVTGLRRHQSFSFVGMAIFSAILVSSTLRDLLSRRAVIVLPLALGVFVLALASGHRTAFIQIISILFFLSLFQRYWTPLRVVVAVLVVTTSVLVLYLTAVHLPLAVQRSVSFLPGIEVVPLAFDNAADTLNDRIGVLKLAIKDIPQYLAIGRGFGMERIDILPSDSVYSGVWLQYMNGFFYNGLIGSILKTGLAGVLCTGAFVIWISRMAFQVVGLVRRIELAQWTVFERLCLLLCAQWFSLLWFFYLLHGDAATWAQYFALPSAMIIACRRLLQDRVNAAQQVSGPSGEIAPAASRTA